MQIVAQAISQSAAQYEIAHIRVGGGNSPATATTVRAALAGECEGSVTHAAQDGVRVSEYWGVDIDGCEWRVHVHVEVGS